MKITPDLVIFITGGASGLGEATARHMHSLGAKVAIADINSSRMLHIASELQKNFIWFDCDVTNEFEVKSAMEGTVNRFGTIHVALASAGVILPGFTMKMDISRFKKCF